MRKIFSLLISIILSLSLYSQSWNLVWREDFGVAEDTVIKDFPDPTMEIPNHQFATNPSRGECGSIDDGYYGIANSTYWSYNRPKACNKNAGHFVGGRDHTGNEKGCMLIINSGAAMGEVIYSQDIEFNLCDSRVYRFQLSTASITTYTDMAHANLVLKIINKNTNTLVGSIETGEIPFWWYETEWGKPGGSSEPFYERNWSDYYLDFMARTGDALSLQVINMGTGSGGGNDFVIDDISLFRYDDVEVIDPVITSNTLSTENELVAGACSFKASFIVSADVLENWQNIYSNVYFLWQSSTDDGLTWNNELAESGIEKLNATFTVDKDVTSVYRVIITGASTAQAAEESALYISEHGGPIDGCSFFSISNIMAGVQPVVDCSVKPTLKQVWKEDFSVMDESLVQNTSLVGSDLQFYDEFTRMENIAPSYAVTSNARERLYYKEYHSWDNTYATQYHETNVSNYVTLPKNNAYLYMRVNRSTGTTADVLIDKTFSNVFCNCKNYVFKFNFMPLASWTSVDLTVNILDKANNVLATNSINYGGTGSPDFREYSTAFDLPYGYTGDVRVQILNNSTNLNYAAPIMFDDFALLICSEKSPQGKLQIDNNASLMFISDFDCDATPPHIVNLVGIDDWAAQYPNFGYVWQQSTDGIVWSTISETSQNHYCDDLENGQTLYRVILAESQTVAQQIAQNGRANDACAVHYITNSVGFFCKGISCEVPKDITITYSKANKVLCTNEIATLTPTTQNSQTAFSQEWYKGSSVTPIAGFPITTDVAELSIDEAGLYRIKVYDVANPTVEKCWKTAEIEIFPATLPTVKIANGSSYCKGDEVTPVEFTFTGEQPFTFTYTVSGTPKNETSTELRFYPEKPSAEGNYEYAITSLHDKYCSAIANATTSTITIKPVPSAEASIVKSSVCAGETVELQALSDQSTASFVWSGPLSFSATSATPILTNSTVAITHLRLHSMAVRVATRFRLRFIQIPKLRN